METIIPSTIPASVQETYTKNIATITKNTNKLMLFAADQKMEHLNEDFYGKNIAADATDPEHLFRIASQGRIGAFATHLGLIARYGRSYPNIPYIVKLNGKTNLIPAKTHIGRWTGMWQYMRHAVVGKDPMSTQLWSVNDVVTLQKNSSLNICGVGYTIYLGSEYEQEMLAQAAQMVFQAHQHGLVAILWIYPRSCNIKDDQDPQLVAGATGVALSLGADFVKIKAPHKMNDLALAVASAGNTSVICSGGATKKPELFLQELYDQLHTGKTSGCATGRNIFQKSLPEAVAFTRAISALVYDNQSVQDAMAIIKS